MDTSWLNQAKKLDYIAPEPVLRAFAATNDAVANSDLPEMVKRLRTNKLKPLKEIRLAALFCHGMGEHLGHTVYFSPIEASNYDFIAAWDEDQERHLIPVQLKEIAPEDLNPLASIDHVLASLSKYGHAPDLTVAVHWNRNEKVAPDKIKVPDLGIGSLWLFACTSPKQSEWMLTGDFMGGDLVSTPFRCPA